MTPEREQTRAPRPAIAEVVLALPRPEHRWRFLAAALIAGGLHASLGLWSHVTERSLESWSAAVAARVHAELSREEYVDLSKPPAPPASQSPKNEEPMKQPAPSGVHLKSRTDRIAHTKPQPPAQAGAIVARADDAPVDLTTTTFVTGSASAYAGGVTASKGTSSVAVHERYPAPPAGRVSARPSEPDRSSAVALEDQNWSCLWPRAADAEQIDEQTVVIRVVVRADGSAESVTVVADPGHGFAQAAAACAMHTEFTPARDRAGEPIRAKSPPIRVRFTR